MSISDNLDRFMGKPVEDFDADEGIKDPAGIAYRIRLDYDETEEGTSFADKLAALLDDPAAARLESLLVGNWGDVAAGDSAEPVVEALAAARDRLAGLRHLFFGDITGEESEISWINQSDVSPLLEAYPKLEHLTVRGGTGLSLGTPRHATLRELIIQSGGLPPQVVHEVSSAELPALEHLELWLGDPSYGGDARAEDLASLLKGDRFPRLKYLGLKNSEIQDEIAAVLANAPIVGQLETLDLSMGTLTDEGARALLASPAIKRLKKLDVHHHFLSDEVVAQLNGLGIEVDASDKQEADEWGGEVHRFIAVSE